MVNRWTIRRARGGWRIGTRLPASGNLLFGTAFRKGRYIELWTPVFVGRVGQPLVVGRQLRVALGIWTVEHRHQLAIAGEAHGIDVKTGLAILDDEERVAPVP